MCPAKPHKFDKNLNKHESILLPEIVWSKSQNNECSLENKIQKLLIIRQFVANRSTTYLGILVEYLITKLE